MASVCVHIVKQFAFFQQYLFFYQAIRFGAVYQKKGGGVLRNNRVFFLKVKYDIENRVVFCQACLKQREIHDVSKHHGFFGAWQDI